MLIFTVTSNNHSMRRRTTLTLTHDTLTHRAHIRPPRCWVVKLRRKSGRSRKETCCVKVQCLRRRSSVKRSSPRSCVSTPLIISPPFAHTHTHTHSLSSTKCPSRRLLLIPPLPSLSASLHFTSTTTRTVSFRRRSRALGRLAFRCTLWLPRTHARQPFHAESALTPREVWCGCLVS